MQVGQFAVVKRSYGAYVCVHVTKVTAKTFEATGEWSSRAHRYYIEDAVFTGPEADARALSNGLQESQERHDAEKQAAHEAKIGRDVQMIAAATAALTVAA